MRDLVLLRCADRAALRGVLDHARAVMARHAAGAVEIDVWQHDRAGLALIQSQVRGAGDRLAMHSTRGEAFAYSGFVAQAAHQPGEVRRLIELDAAPVMTRSPGGIATYFLADAKGRRIAAWSSHAGMEGPYVTVGEHCTAISNRPLLSHLAGRGSQRPSFSARWARRVLLGGATLWDDTPFEGTILPPPRSAVVVGDEVRFVAHPVPLAGRYGKRDPAGVEALCAAALEAVAPLRRWPRGELWLSGGKDSRMAAALIRRAGIDVDSLTHARDGAGEGEAAAAVARALGHAHRITPAGGIATGDDLLATVLTNLRRSDGLVAEARHLAYPALPHSGEPIIQGQAHHARGGYSSAWAPPDALRSRLTDATAGDVALVDEQLAAERRARLDEILDGYSIRYPCELAYWLYSDWRMTRWTAAAYRAASRSRPVVWPMMDERVLAITAALHPLDRAKEVACFDAVMHLAPELGPVPLYEDTWRFDQVATGANEWRDSRDQRRVPFREGGGRRTDERRVATVQPLFRLAMNDLAGGRELAGSIRPQALTALCDEADPALALGRPHMQIINFMWKATAVALVTEGSWLTPAS
jgi:hypothetical protein